MNEDLIETLDSIVWYNGLGEALKILKEQIKYHDFSKGSFLIDKRNIGLYSDEQFEIFWMILVLQFGDYGTSPRSGWILEENKDKVIEFIDKITSTYSSSDEYLEDLEEINDIVYSNLDKEQTNKIFKDFEEAINREDNKDETI